MSSWARKGVFCFFLERSEIHEGTNAMHFKLD
jgi:hypothetical protein